MGTLQIETQQYTHYYLATEIGMVACLPRINSLGALLLEMRNGSGNKKGRLVRHQVQKVRRLCTCIIRMFVRPTSPGVYDHDDPN